jgi:hypothetical protein
MQIRFNGGPWDGVEFEAPFCPDAIGFRHTDTRDDPVEGKPFQFKVRSAERNHHLYLYDKVAMREGAEPVFTDSGHPLDAADLLERGDESLIVMHYRYTPTEGAWWEQDEREKGNVEPF